MANHPTSRGGTESLPRPSEPPDAKAPAEPTAFEGIQTPNPPPDEPLASEADGDSAAPGHVAMLRQRLLELLDENDET